MTSKTTPLDPVEFAARMAATLKDPRAVACPQAFFFLSVFRDTDAPMPTISQARELIRALTSHSVLMLSCQDVARVRGHTSLHADLDDGAFIVFEDFSALWFDDKDKIGETEITMDAPFGVTFGQNFPSGLNLAVLEVSAGFATRFGQLEGFLHGDDELAQDYMDDLFQRIFDEVDPPADGNDEMVQNWTNQDAENLDELVTLVWLGIGTDFEVETEILSASDVFEHDISLRAGQKDASGHKDRIMARFISCMDTLENLDRFQGWDWVSNDGAYDRMSGYTKTSITVLWQTFDPADKSISNHMRISASSVLRRKLAAKGMPADDIEGMLSSSLAA